MATVTKYDASGARAGEIALGDAVFAARIMPQSVYESVLRQLANRRHANPTTKDRAEVRGGGRKPWKQKGTGRARAGSTRSPLWRTGGVAMGPDGRNYQQSLPRKVRRAALRSILTDKVRQGKLGVISPVVLEAPRTRKVVELLEKLEVGQARTLFVLAERNDNFQKSVRNLTTAKALVLSCINAHDLLNYERIFLFEDAAKKIEEVFAE
ncbi:MAG: 50S ribosomal protein L4 [Candidatus Riflebacteria bacterium]|nr:50S ribosomal protein L4 [Candidatus Riflebacteria bacterium]